MDYTINIRGQLLELSQPQVMGILNVTPDSFYAKSRTEALHEIAARANQIVAEGGTIIDVGACSTRPGSTQATEEEELQRLRRALDVVRREQPDVALSVDTYRPDVARMAVEEFGADIINDVGAPAVSSELRSPVHSLSAPSTLAPAASRTEMFRMVAKLGIPYIYMSTAGSLRQVMLDFAQAVQQLRDLGQKDIILDPGFGFGKTLEQNYEVLGGLNQLQALQLPVLVGLSRKSMIYRLLDSTPDRALTGTIALNALALERGASILRVHDVHEAVECCKLVETLKAEVSF